MDDRRFDDLTRRLASGTSRRQVLKTLAGGALGGLTGALGLDRTTAAGCNTDAECGRGETCDPATGRCMRRGGGGDGRPANQNQTQSQSVGIAADCISEPSVCTPNEECIDGVCTPRGGGQCVRGSGCTSDATCCGSEVCDTLNQLCVGAGGPCTNDTGTCFDSTECCGNEECVGNTCQQMTGGCAPGAVCAGDAECCGGQVCVNATCAQAARTAGCPEGQARCSGVCVDIQNDPANCGACGVVCPVGQTCVGGTCQASGELCGFGDAAVVCGPCEFCAGMKHPVCVPCVEGCQTCIEGVCVTQCTACESCTANSDEEVPYCAEQCTNQCAVCDPVNGCVSTCTACESCTIDSSGARCVEQCDACSVCDPINGCISACTGCERCDGNTGTCVDVCAENCAQCINGICEPLCGICENCVGSLADGFTCVSVCLDPCTRCEAMPDGSRACIPLCTAEQTCLEGVCV